MTGSQGRTWWARRTCEYILRYDVKHEERPRAGHFADFDAIAAHHEVVIIELRQHGLNDRLRRLVRGRRERRLNQQLDARTRHVHRRTNCRRREDERAEVGIG